MIFSSGFRVLPAGRERIARGADAEPLPIRELVIDRDGRNLTVWIGPVEPGGPERELWELDVAI